MTIFRVICARLPGNELISAECHRLTGSTPDAEGVAEFSGEITQRAGRVQQSAYLSLLVKCLAEYPGLDGLVQKVDRLRLAPESFKVEVFCLPSRKDFHRRQSVIRLADVICSAPDLVNPAVTYLLVAQKDRLWFGELIARNERGYLIHDKKPYRISTALSSRLARALVNLVRDTSTTLLDPFCGAGSILLEAQALGLSVFGVDRNSKMVGMTRQNLGFFGYQGLVQRGDAGDCPFRADAIVTDLPYGRVLEEDPPGLRKILARLACLAPAAVYVTERDISEWMKQAGYTGIEIYPVKKRDGMCRLVHTGHSSVNG
jgi:tRNA G10  N-methylase Trm11